MNTSSNQIQFGGRSATEAARNLMHLTVQEEEGMRVLTNRCGIDLAEVNAAFERVEGFDYDAGRSRREKEAHRRDLHLLIQWGIHRERCLKCRVWLAWCRVWVPVEERIAALFTKRRKKGLETGSTPETPDGVHKAARTALESSEIPPFARQQGVNA